MHRKQAQRAQGGRVTPRAPRAPCPVPLRYITPRRTPGYHSHSVAAPSTLPHRSYPSLYNNGCQARRFRRLRGSGARHGAARGAGAGADAAAGRGEARGRVPEDHLGAVGRAGQQREHAGCEQGAQGGLRLRAAATVPAVYQPAERHQRRERQGEGGSGDVARQHREGGRRAAQGAPRGGAAGGTAARPPAGRRHRRRRRDPEAGAGGRRARRPGQHQAGAADQAGLRRLRQAGRGRPEEAARGRQQAVSRPLPRLINT